MRKRHVTALVGAVLALAAGIAYAVLPGSSQAVGIGPFGVGYQVFGSSIPVTAVKPDPSQQIVSLTLPPGSYAISAEFNFEKPTDRLGELSSHAPELGRALSA